MNIQYYKRLKQLPSPWDRERPFGSSWDYAQMIAREVEETLVGSIYRLR